KKAILGIVTDSRAPGQPKDTESSNLFAIFQAFADAKETDAMRAAFADGIGWGEAKQKLFERIDAELSAPRERYEALLRRPDDIEDDLLAGARKARERSAPFIAALREAGRLGSPRGRIAADDRASESPAATSGAAPRLKSYREADGRFYFKLVDGSGDVLLQSRGFASPRDSGRFVAALLDAGGWPPAAIDAAVVEAPADPSRVAAALARLKADRDAKAHPR